MHTPKDICTLIVAACIFYNLCINANDHVDEYIVCDETPHPNNYLNVFANCPDGTQMRNAIMNALPLCHQDFPKSCYKIGYCVIINYFTFL